MKSSIMGIAIQFVRKEFTLVEINLPIGISIKVYIFEMATGEN